MRQNVLFVIGILVLTLFGQLVNAQLRIGGKIDVETYPIAMSGDDVLVEGEGKKISFVLANYSEGTITRAAKLFIFGENTGLVTVWEDVITLGPWGFENVEILGCGNEGTLSPAGDYALVLKADNTSVLDSITINSPSVSCADGASSCNNPQVIEILPAGSFDSGCYGVEFIDILFPLQGNNIARGQTYTIRWESNVINTVEIKLYRNNGSVYAGTIAHTTDNDGEFLWTCPNDLMLDNDYQILIAEEGNDTPIETMSDIFSVVSDVVVDNNLPCQAQQLLALPDTTLLLCYNVGTTDSGVEPPPCADYIPNNSYGDLWYKFVVPASGQAIVVFDTVNIGNTNDWGAALYQGNCDNLNLVECNDDGGVQVMPELELNDANPGETYYVRVWDYSCNSEGNFEIAVVDPNPTVSLLVEGLSNSPNPFQKGEAAEASAWITNTGNVFFDGTVFLSWHDANHEFLSDLAQYTGIQAGAAIELVRELAPIVSDTGTYFLVVKYLEAGTQNYVVLQELEVQVLGLQISGNTPVVTAKSNNYYCEMSVLAQNPGYVDLLGFVWIKNLDTDEIDFFQMDAVVSKTNAISFEYILSNLDVGSYEVRYFSFYDWFGGIIEGIPWWSFFSSAYALEVGDSAPTLLDMTEIPDGDIIQKYTEIPFFLNILDPSGLDINAQIRFLTPNGEIVYKDMNYNENSGGWELPMTLNEAGTYNYRFVVTREDIHYFFPIEEDDALQIETLPVLTTNPVYSYGGDVYVYDWTLLYFYAETSIPEENIAGIRLEFDAPDGETYPKDLVSTGDGMFLYAHSMQQTGGYDYKYILTTNDQREFVSESREMFVGFGDNCDVVTQPTMIYRTSWCSGCNNENENNGTPTHIVIHHSVTPNGDNSYERLRNIRQGHLNLGDPDIGYHYLIGSNGKIFEGLQGGPEKKGSHFSCMNGRTIGICLLGSFMDEAPTEIAMQSLDILLEWLCAEYNIDPNGIQDHTFWDASSGLWKTNVDMPQIVPHKISSEYPENTCSVTVCPGNQFPDISLIVAPHVVFCPSINSQQNIELNSALSVDIDYADKSTSCDVKISTSIISLFENLNIKLKAVLVKDGDTLVVGESDIINLLTQEEFGFVTNNQMQLAPGDYQAMVFYQVPGSDLWHHLLSELYPYKIPVAINGISSVNGLVNKIFIYPIPTDDVLTVKVTDIGESFELSMYDTYGKKHINKNFVNEIEIDVSTIPAGIYFVKLRTNKKTFIQKIIIQ